MGRVGAQWQNNELRDPKFKGSNPTTTGIVKKGIAVYMARNGIAVVKQLNRHSKLRGSKHTTNGIVKEDIAVYMARNGSTVVKQLTHYSKFEGSNLTTTGTGKEEVLLTQPEMVAQW